MPPAADANPLIDRMSQPIVTSTEQESRQVEAAQREVAPVDLSGVPKNGSGRVNEAPPLASLCILLIWVIIGVILGSPWWGANSGSPIISAVAFGTGWLVLRGSRKLWLFAFGFAIIGAIV